MSKQVIIDSIELEQMRERIHEAEIRDQQILLKEFLGTIQQMVQEKAALHLPIDLPNRQAIVQPQVFLSYAWEAKDTPKLKNLQTLLKNLAADLEAAGLKPWFDLQRMTGHLDRQMRENIKKSQYVLLIGTNRYAERTKPDSDTNVRNELNVTLEEEAKKSADFILPLMLEGDYDATFPEVGKNFLIRDCSSWHSLDQDQWKSFDSYFNELVQYEPLGILPTLLGLNRIDQDEKLKTYRESCLTDYRKHQQALMAKQALSRAEAQNQKLKVDLQISVKAQELLTAQQAQLHQELKALQDQKQQVSSNNQGKEEWKSDLDRREQVLNIKQKDLEMQQDEQKRIHDKLQYEEERFNTLNREQSDRIVALRLWAEELEKQARKLTQIDHPDSKSDWSPSESKQPNLTWSFYTLPPSYPSDYKDIVIQLDETGKFTGVLTKSDYCPFSSHRPLYDAVALISAQNQDSRDELISDEAAQQWYSSRRHSGISGLPIDKIIPERRMRESVIERIHPIVAKHYYELGQAAAAKKEYNRLAECWRGALAIMPADYEEGEARKVLAVKIKAYLSQDTWRLASEMIQSGQLPALQWLLIEKTKLDIQQLDDKGESLLIQAMRYRQIEIVNWLIQQPGSQVLITKANRAGEFPLHIAAELGDISLMQFLLPEQIRLLPQTEEKLENLNVLNRQGETPLHIAAKLNRTEIVQFLLEHGANFKINDTEGNTALHASAKTDAVESSLLLLQRGLLLHHTRNKAGKTPRQVAEEKNKTKWVEQYDANLEKLLECKEEKLNIDPNANMLFQMQYIVVTQQKQLDQQQKKIDDLEEKISSNHTTTKRTFLFLFFLLIISFLIGRFSISGQSSLKESTDKSLDIWDDLRNQAKKKRLEIEEIQEKMTDLISFKQHFEIQNPTVDKERCSLETTECQETIQQQHLAKQGQKKIKGEDGTSSTTSTRSQDVTVESISQNSQGFMRKSKTIPPVEQMKLQDQLITACIRGELRIVKSLLKKGAQPGLASKDGEQPLGAAVWGMNPAVVSVLIAKNGGVVPLTWEECKKHNLKLYKEVFIVPKYNPQTAKELRNLKMTIESHPFLSEKNFYARCNWKDNPHSSFGTNFAETLLNNIEDNMFASRLKPTKEKGNDFLTHLENENPLEYSLYLTDHCKLLIDQELYGLKKQIKQEIVNTEGLVQRISGYFSGYF